MLWIFHGYSQSGEIVKKKLQRILHSSDLFTPDGPVVAESGYGWWKLSREHLRDAPSAEEISSACELGRKFVSEVGQPSAVIGFSQGASYATLLIAEKIITPAKVILMSNFAMPGLACEEKIKIPSLHLFGLQDELLLNCVGWTDLSNPSETKAWILETCADWSLVPFYESPQIEFHRWGHVIPSTKIYREMICNFIEPAQTAKPH